MAMADLTINYQREMVVDFTMPFLDLGMYLFIAFRLVSLLFSVFHIFRTYQVTKCFIFLSSRYYFGKLLSQEHYFFRHQRFVRKSGSKRRQFICIFVTFVRLRLDFNDFGGNIRIYCNVFHSKVSCWFLCIFPVQIPHLFSYSGSVPMRH